MKITIEISDEYKDERTKAIADNLCAALINTFGGPVSVLVNGERYSLDRHRESGAVKVGRKR